MLGYFKIQCLLLTTLKISNIIVKKIVRTVERVKT